MQTTALFRLLLPSLALAFTATASAQIYLAESDLNRVGKYDSATGGVIDADFIAAPDGPFGLVLAGSSLYVASFRSGEVSIYDAGSGVALAEPLFTTLGNGPRSMVAYGTDLFVAVDSNDRIVRHNATTGAEVGSPILTDSYPRGMVIVGDYLLLAHFFGGIARYHIPTGMLDDGAFITGLSVPYGLALSGTTLYVAELDGGRVGTYDATTGAAIDADFITGLANPLSLALDGDDLYVGVTGAKGSPGSVGKYNAVSGAVIDAGFISNITGPAAIIVVPEPGSALLLASAVPLLLRRRRR